MLSLADIFTAYYDCRRHKRNTYGALEFELHYESECIKLYHEIIERRYRLRPCTAFIVRDPVQREIFASHFRDRVVHHLIARRLEPILERVLIHDVYSSSKGKGTHYGIQRIEKFMRACSDNYQRDAYILKLDISGFFMSIDRELLWEKIQDFILSVRIPPGERGLGGFCSETKSPQSSLSRGSEAILTNEQDIFLSLIHMIISSDPRKDLKICGKRTDWIGLPKSKSLFYTKSGCGLPIGNLTSQLFANIYMHEFDVFVKKTLKVRYYGRYVDDFVLIYEDDEYLKGCIPKVREFLERRLSLTLHPKKIYLQHISKGVLFLGTYIKPWRKYVGRRTKGNFYRCIDKINQRLRNPEALSDEEMSHFLSQMNAYLGLMSHADSYRLREKMMREVDGRFGSYFCLSRELEKVILKH